MFFHYFWVIRAVRAYSNIYAHLVVKSNFYGKVFKGQLTGKLGFFMRKFHALTSMLFYQNYKEK